MPKRDGGKPHHVSKVYRWSLRGMRGVVLETVQCGGTRCTTVEALERFFARLSALNLPQMTTTTAPAIRERQIENACAKLKDLLGSGR